ncbi:MAG: hypothetical protein KTQ49_00840 [Candidatus Omnitrophica bacterium]|nr:hypothetical protein [Candidatus Omnitrophota bacterium]
MDKGQKIGLGLGVIGTVLGSTMWMVLLGFSLRSWTLILVPAIAAVLCGGIGLWLLWARPERSMGIFGLIGLWLVLLNGIFANAYYDRIPETLGGISTGKGDLALFQINVFLGVLMLFASGCIIRQFLKDR